MNERHGPDFPGTHSGNSQKPPPEIPVEVREEEEVFVESPPRENWRGEIPPNERAPGWRDVSPQSPSDTDKIYSTETSAGARRDKVPRRKLTPTEANWAMGCHLAAVFGYISFIGFVVGPLVVWFLKKGEDEFIDEQGKEAVNFQLSMILYYIGAAILSLVLIGIPILIGLFIFQLVEIILGSVRAKEGVSYKYPLTIRFIS